MARSEEVALVLDAGALIGFGRDERVEALVRLWSDNGGIIVIPAVVLAEVIRGGPKDANVNRLVKTAKVVVPIDESIAREAGARIAKHGKGGKDTVDALVVATAVRCGAKSVVTSDPDDIERLGAGDVKAIPI